MSRLALVLLAWGTASTGAASEADILEKARQALQQRRAHLVGYSMQVHVRTLSDTPRGRRKTESLEEHFRGAEGQFRRDVLRMTRDGAAVDPSQAGRRGRRNRQGGAGQRVQQLDLLGRPGLLDKAEVAGPARLGDREVIEIRFRPSLPRIQADKGSLWVDPRTGMPLQVEIKFGLGAFVSDAQLKLELTWDRSGQFTVARRQVLRFSSGGGFGGRRGGGGGGQTEIVTTWKNYRWGLTFDEGFFEVQSASQNEPRRRRNSRQAAAQAQPEEDPFEEIRIRPLGAPQDGDPDSRLLSASSNEVFIEGASTRGASQPGMNEARIVQRVLGGGRGFGDRGRGGGGLRGARIAGSRANRLQGNLNAGFSASALDARPYSLNGEEIPEPDYFTWQAGISVGGPLGGSTSGGGFPAGGRFGGGRPSFFVDFNTRRGEQLRSAYAAVPTLAERQGDFSQTAYQSGPLAGQPVEVYDPSTGSAFPNATLPSGQLDGTALGLLEFIPLPNRDDSFLNFFNQESLQNTRDRLNLRLQLPLMDALRLSASYSFNRSDSDTFNVFPGLGSQRKGRGQNLRLSFNQTLRRGLIHNFRVSWNRNRNRTLNPFAFQRDIAAELGIQNTSPHPIDYGLTAINFTNYTTLDDGNSSFNVNEAHTISDNLLLVRGRHFFRIGGDFSWRRINRLSNPLGAGSQTFAGVATSLYLDGRPVGGSGYDLADFLLGFAQSSRIQYGNSDHYLRRRELALFINDNWRLHSKLTLQWGVRYQYVQPWSEKFGRIANLDVGPGFSDAETVTPGSVGSFFGPFPPALVESDANNLAPRLALAYRLRSGRRSSVLRAEYGVFYPDEAYSSFANELISQPPFGFTVQETAPAQQFLGIRTAFSPQLAEEVPNSYAVDPRFRLSTVQHWSLSWQQSLPANFFVSLGYAGSRGTGLELLRAPNRVLDGQAQIEDAAQFLYLTSGASSAFHGLQVLATRRMRSGFSFNLQYELGKSLDNASAIGGGARIVAQNDSDLDSERGRSRFDQRHRLRLNWFLEVPLGDRHRWLRNSGWLTALGRNWFLTGRLQASSGAPFTARVLGNQINNSGSASQASERASVTGLEVGLSPSQRSVQQWFNTDAFRLPDPGAFGDAGRGTINGPGSWTIDLTLTRSIPLKADGKRLVLSIAAANLLNQVNFTGLNTTVNSRGFGQVTSVGRMRTVQMNFRFMF